jgi:hypothetical protein
LRLKANVEANFNGATMVDIPGYDNSCLFLAVTHQILLAGGSFLRARQRGPTRRARARRCRRR